ncbi:sulfotransferase domain-containing protein [Leekyejoonella antrihumi]|uniref:Sulfotransferase domain-containing protein n=1 Tax=Leekyejoonella antrihumi TaxID=1660198 RepID=A0A563DUW1_9MICO|nr:sulfotransferase domain-containing protein [Leekyejoonella antrihumi]TWP33484.1 sulfotransferase domain-containing protein [Leekyejoonella antrihumi]
MTLAGERTRAFGSAGRESLKTITRQVGVATSALRPPPDFLIIGTKRGGTTSFYFDLLDHPDVMRLYPPPLPLVKREATKGVHYFDSNFTQGERWYRSYMPTEISREAHRRRHGVRPVAGEASPYYLFHPAAAERAHRSVPDARIIVLLRDPVLRTYSHWKERRRGHAEPLDFLDALEAEPSRLAGERDRLLAEPGYTSYAWEQQSYVTQSLYADALRPWFDRFGHERVFVAASEDYYADPAAVLGQVDTFLGLPPRASSTGIVRNAAQGAPLPDSVRMRLDGLFAGPNAALAALTGRDFEWS